MTAVATYKAPNSNFNDLAGVSDINADGSIDFVTESGGVVSTYLGNGDGTFQTAIIKTGPTTDGEAVLGDFNGDGVDDYAGGVRTAHDPIQYMLADVGGAVERALGITAPTIDLRSRQAALTSLEAAKSNLTDVSSARGNLGSMMIRLEVQSSKIHVTNEAYAGAISRILDVDIASESSRLVAATIRQQVSSQIARTSALQADLSLSLLKF